MKQKTQSGNLVAILVMMFLFAMVAFVTNMAAPFGLIWKEHYAWAGMVGNLMNFAAYLFMGIPAGMLLTKIGYKKTALVALALGFVGVLVQFVSSKVGAETEIFGGVMTLNYLIYLVGALIGGFCVCILNTVVNPMLNILGGGGNRGNQFIQIGGSLNSLAATLTPMLVGIMLAGAVKPSMEEVTPLLLIAMGIFAFAFVVIFFTGINEPEVEKTNVMEGIKGALGYSHLVLGIIAIFFYVGIEVGIPGQLLFYIPSLGIDEATAVAGSVAGIYWLLMLFGRLGGSAVSGVISARTQLTVVSSVAIILVVAAILTPASVEVTLFGYKLPISCFMLVACGLCTSVMWGGIFNLATEGLGKYTAAASGLFMTMVVGGGVMPLIQDKVATSIDIMSSYWVIVAMLAYLLFFAVIGSKTKK